MMAAYIAAALPLKRTTAASAAVQAVAACRQLAAASLGSAAGSPEKVPKPEVTGRAAARNAWGASGQPTRTILK
jgi:hypothetical protein